MSIDSESSRIAGRRGGAAGTCAKESAQRPWLPWMPRTVGLGFLSAARVLLAGWRQRIAFARRKPYRGLHRHRGLPVTAGVYKDAEDLQQLREIEGLHQHRGLTPRRQGCTQSLRGTGAATTEPGSTTRCTGRVLPHPTTTTAPGPGLLALV